MSLYRVTARYGRGQEVAVDQFKDYKTASEFAHDKFEQDFLMKVSVTYFVYEGYDLMETVDAVRATTSSEGAGAQQTNAQTFNPNPFQMAPRPGGMPQSGLKDQDDEKKK
jgi:hypothetical protein